MAIIVTTESSAWTALFFPLRSSPLFPLWTVAVDITVRKDISNPLFSPSCRPKEQFSPASCLRELLVNQVAHTCTQEYNADIFQITCITWYSMGYVHHTDPTLIDLQGENKTESTNTNMDTEVSGPATFSTSPRPFARYRKR